MWHRCFVLHIFCYLCHVFFLFYPFSSLCFHCLILSVFAWPACAWSDNRCLYFCYSHNKVSCESLLCMCFQYCPSSFALCRSESVLFILSCYMTEVYCSRKRVGIIWDYVFCFMWYYDSHSCTAESTYNNADFNSISDVTMSSRLLCVLW